MPIRPLDLPEIREHIGLFLSKQDLLCCILVCQKWHQSFKHLLYRDIDFLKCRWWMGPPLDHLYSPLSGDHQHPRHISYSSHVRRLNYVCERRFDYLKPTYTNLESLSLVWDFNDDGGVQQHHHGQLVDFIQRHHSTLKEIAVSETTLGLPVYLWELLAEETLFPKLMTLTVTEDRRSDQGRSPAFWRACARVQALELDGFRYDVPDSPQVWPEFNCLESLILHKSESHYISKQVELLPLLTKCPRLKSLQWVLHRRYYSCSCCSDIEDDADDPDVTTCSVQIIDGLADLITSARLLHLTSLELTMHPYDGPIQSTRDALLAAFAKLLNNLTLPLTRFGLYDFDIDSHLTFPAMQRHFATIRFLDISMIPSDSSWMVQTIMTSCPLLEDFSGDVIRVLDMMEGAPWVCFGLQILRLVFEVDPENRTPGRTKKDQCLFAYRQLSRLSRLRELDYHGRNSTLEDWHNEERLSSILIQSSRHNRDLCFEPHIQGVHVYSHHYWHSDYPRPEDFEQK